VEVDVEGAGGKAGRRRLEEMKFLQKFKFPQKLSSRQKELFGEIEIPAEKRSSRQRTKFRPKIELFGEIEIPAKK
jgi:hypothetical protein